MTTHYSILSVNIRPEIQEKISIGFLLVCDSQVFFNYSKNKLSAAKSLLTDHGYRMLRDSLKNVESAAVNENEKLNVRKQMLLSSSLENSSFSISYISYISRYNNNVLSFSAPKKIDVAGSEEIFFKLFRLMVDDSESLPSVLLSNNLESFKTVNRPRLKKYFNVEKEFTSNEIPNLLAPVKVDLIGRNDKPVYAQSIELNRIVYHIENDLAQLLLLQNAFASENKSAKGFVLTSEPDKRETKQHNIWNQLRNNRLFEYVDISEGEKIIQYAEAHNVQPLVADDFESA